jgi:8-oxo-dGTP pyrophosphatase MutT (NUDIX family)
MVRDAATLILLRSDPLEVFMVKRHSKSGFMANAWVYPGGALDDADLSEELLARCDLTADEAARRLGMQDKERALGLYLAVIREAFEEAGVLFASRRGESGIITIDDDRFETYRQRLNAGTMTLLELAVKEDLVFPVSALSFFAHWITPTLEARRFDTRFFVIEAPDQFASHDACETTDGCWLTLQEALERGESGEWFLAPPTIRTLQQVLEAGGLKGVEDLCNQRRPPRLLPHLEVCDDHYVLLLPGDPDFPNLPEYAIAEPVDDDVTRMTFFFPDSKK